MIRKRIQPTSWFGERPTTTLLDTYSKGFNKNQLQKIAADSFIFNVDITPAKGKSYIHVITTGAGETYGSNTNGDFFNKQAGEYTFSNGKTANLGGGLKGYHNTFMKYGGVYRNHFNSKKGAQKEGEVYAECFNPEMNRGELILELDSNKWHTDLTKLANNMPLMWSMGAGVPRDLCSVCGNSAPTRKDYCDHLKYAMLQLDKTGRQICAINDQPHFHDISEVLTAADRIAFGLRKVAAANAGMVLEEEDLTGIYLPIDLINKIGNRQERSRSDLIYKLARIEKRIEMEGTTPDERNLIDCFSCNEDNSEDIISKLKHIDLDKLMYALNENGVLLPPKAFVRIVTGKPAEEIEGLEELPHAVKDMFSHASKNEGFEELVNDGSYSPCLEHPGRSVMTLGNNLADSLSLHDEPLKTRVIRVTIRGGNGEKEASQSRNIESPAARVLATEYAKYQLSYLAGNHSDDLIHRVAIHNQA